MSAKLIRDRARAALEKSQAAMDAMLEEVTTKRKAMVEVPVMERQVEMQNGRKRVVAERMVRQPVEVELYPVKDAIAVARYFVDLGVGKMPEEKNVNIDITARRIEDATDEQLSAIIEGRVRELEA